MRRRVSEAAENGPLAQAPGSEIRDSAHPRVGQQDQGPRVPPYEDPPRPRSLQEGDRQPGEKGEGHRQGAHQVPGRLWDGGHA